MQNKYVLAPERLRHIPKGFSWIDHRFVNNKHISQCSHLGLSLYLLLVTVADAQGLSYYADPTVMKRLKMTPSQLAIGRQELIDADLIAYAKPLCQVLALDDLNARPMSSTPRTGNTLALQDILTKIAERNPS